jgi:hypothetical protein
MYDTIHLWLPIDLADGFNVSKTLEPLQGITEHKKQDGEVYISGTLGTNIRACISSNGISLKGSLPKYYLPNNFHTLTRSDSARAIEKMSDELFLPMNRANVKRIDFAQNFLMDYEPEAYYPYLGECQYYNRFPQARSVYYSNGLRQKVFYNKVAEGKAKGLILPQVWTGKHVLRYEIRFTSRLCKQFNLSEITAKTLSDEKFYINLFERWHNEYESIQKIKNINFNLSDMNTPKDFHRQLEMFAIKTLGQEKIMQEIESMRAMNVFEQPEYYSRLKKEVRVLCNTPELTTSSDLVAELDKKIRDSKRYYR